VPTFSIANINPGHIRCETAVSWLELQNVDTQRFLTRLTEEHPDPDPVRLDHIWSKIAGPYLDAARNLMVAGFLDHCSSDYLVFIDSDVAPRVDDYYTLVAAAHQHQLGCLSGVYYSPQPQTGIGPVVFHWGGPEDALPPWTIQDLEALDPDRPHPVDVVGAGFLCLSRRLLLEMRDKYEAPLHWFICQTHGGMFQGEDTGLCHRLADWSDDCRPHVLPGLVANHHKTMPLGNGRVRSPAAPQPVSIVDP
jgi:hypothetical protein